MRGRRVSCRLARVSEYDLEAFNLSSPEPPPEDDRGFVVREAVNCRGCGRPLRGLRSGGSCACGARVAWSLWRDAEPTGHDGPIGGGVHCRRCGYDLTGMQLSGKCPECGMSVIRSSAGDMLSSADPAYVAKLHRGALVAEIAFFATVALALLVGGVGMVASFTGDTPVVEAVAGVLSVGVELASLLGWWWLSAPDPAAPAEESTRRARRLVRAAVAVLAVLALFRAAGDLAVAGGAAPGPGMVAFAIALGAVFYIAWFVKLFASVHYLKVLAPRIPDPELVANANRARAWIIATMILFGCAVLAALVLHPALGVLFALVGMLVMLATAVFYVIMLDRARRGLASTMGTMRPIATY